MSETKEKEEVYTVWRVGCAFSHDHQPVELPENWTYVAPGDAMLTRRIKATGNYWQVMMLYKHKPASGGVCAPADVVQAIQAELVKVREDPAYAKRLEKGRQYRAKKEVEYQEDFVQAIIDFLDFHPRWAHVAQKLAAAVAAHATPVGSGTVARTKLIPIEQRAEAAVIAWMRHQTTSYDKMYIEKIAGERREVRRELAQVSRGVLAKYQSGSDINLRCCPLARALNLSDETSV